jgi:UDP-N-acetylmuramoyl-L-alanyl-D-glutamate--2,6-diaminopimelate ligase
MQKYIKQIIENLNILKIYNSQLLDTTIVSGIKYNSKEVENGDIFICLSGEHTDGNLFINEAISKGAVAIVTQKEPQEKVSCPVIIVSDVNSALAKISSNFYEHPSKKVLLIGVTGTNGKTTTCYLLESIFSTAGYKTGVIGTINYRYNNKIFPSTHTTPFSSDLQKILYEMVENKVEVVIMEVSSHSLVQKRVEGCDFDIAIFTNLSSEHLDYHQTMDNYFEAKSLLFKNIKEQKKDIFNNTSLGRKVCVINYNDEYGKKLINLCSIKDILLYCINNKNKNGKYPIFSATNIKYTPSSTEFEITNGCPKISIYSNLIGRFNVENILSSFVAAYSQKIDLDIIKEGIKKVNCIPGRLEKVNVPTNYNVIIDYAHTPDALEKVISILKSIPHKKLIVVFGCGGDRDRSKRPLMGSIATSSADYVIVTSDNPRTEDPNKIILDIEFGIKKSGKTNYEIIPDRKEAIFKALSLASNGDIVLLAGKGHEDYQIIGTKKIHFDEREIVSEFFNKK